MTIIDSYPIVFDNVNRLLCTSGNPNVWVVDEKDPQAKISQLKVFFHTDQYLCFDEQATKGMSDITTSRTSHIIDDECDGIGVFNNEGLNLLVFADLKSNFDTNKIQHAFVQSLCSFMKLHSMLSLCEGYDLEQSDIEFVVTSCCFPNKDKETNTYEWLVREKTANPNSFVSRIAYPLLQNGSTSIFIKDFPIVENIPFNKKILDKKVRLSLVRSKNYTDTFVEYHLAV